MQPIEFPGWALFPPHVRGDIASVSLWQSRFHNGPEAPVRSLKSGLVDPLKAPSNAFCHSIPVDFAVPTAAKSGIVRPEIQWLRSNPGSPQVSLPARKADST